MNCLLNMQPNCWRRNILDVLHCFAMIRLRIFQGCAICFESQPWAGTYIMFKKHVTNEGTALVKQTEDSANNRKPGKDTVGKPAQVFVWKIIELHDKYVAYVTDCFQGYTLFHKFSGSIH